MKMKMKMDNFSKRTSNTSHDTKGTTGFEKKAKEQD